MEITDVKVKLVEDRSDKLLAFCTLTIDQDFVIRDLKIIDGPKGAFVAMPSRKLTDRCSRCGGKNHRLAKFCNSCGGKLGDGRNRRGDGPRTRLHADIAHPITSECREFVQNQVLEAFESEMERSQQDGYVAPDLDADFDDDLDSEGRARRRSEGRSDRPRERARGPDPRPSQQERPPERPPERTPERTPERQPEAQPVARSEDAPREPEETDEASDLPGKGDRKPEWSTPPPRRESSPRPPRDLPRPRRSEDSEDNFSSGIFK